MNESVIFDTHRYVKHITDTGVSQASAEAIVNTIAHVFEHNLSTKDDIKRLEMKIAETKAELIMKIAETKAELIKWLFGTLLGFSTLIVAAILGGLQLFL